MGTDVAPQPFGAHRLDNLGVHLSCPFQKAENDAFPGRPPTSLALAVASPISLIEFDLTPESTGLQFTEMEDGLPQTLIETADHLEVDAQILGPTGGADHLERPTVHALTTPQKVGRTAKKARFPLHHRM